MFYAVIQCVNRKCFILIFYISYHPLQQDNVLDCELVYQTMCAQLG